MADPIDIHVGAAIAAARIARSHNQSDLGRAIGVTFQQIQKYEKGTNRISASRLLAACRFLKVPVSSVFPEEGEAPSGLSGRDQAFVWEMTELADSLSPAQKKLLVGFAKELGGSDS